MSSEDDLAQHAEYIDLVATYTYGLLTSVIRSEEISLTYYQLALRQQRATESEIMEFCKIYASIYVRKTKIENIEERQAVRESLDEAWTRFNGPTRKNTV